MRSVFISYHWQGPRGGWGVGNVTFLTSSLVSPAYLEESKRDIAESLATENGSPVSVVILAVSVLESSDTRHPAAETAGEESENGH